MAAPTYATDLTDITTAESTTGWSALGGGGAGLSASPDLAVQGTNCVDKQVSNAEKGQIFDAGTGVTPGADDHFYVWVFCSTPGLVDTLANRGLAVVIGSSTGNYNTFHMTGSDVFELSETVKCWCVRYVTTASTGLRTLTGTPADNARVYGSTINTTASVKGANLGVDAIRRGTGYYITAGDGTTPATFAGVATHNDDSTRRNGILTAVPGGYALQGRFVIGQNSSKVATAAHFIATNRNVVFSRTVHALSTHTQIIIDHASTIVTMTNCTFQAVGTNNIGRFVVNSANPTVTLPGCKWIGTGITTLRSNTTIDAGIWIGCGQITPNGASLINSTISGYEGTADTAALIYNETADPDAKTTGMSFTKGTAATHAIEFGTSAPTTMTLDAVTFSGYTTGTSAALNFLRTSGTTTLNLVGGTTNISSSIQTTGTHTVVVVISPVAVTVNAVDEAGVPIQNARVLLQASDGTGDLPFEDTVTITTATTTASVAHTAHGMSSGEFVSIKGANEDELNGVFAISNVTTNAYDYTIVSIGGAAGTGTIKATGVVINELTTAGGVATETRSFAANQPVVGRVRKSSASPFYRTAGISGTISASSGFETTVQMVSDE